MCSQIVVLCLILGADILRASVVADKQTGKSSQSSSGVDSGFFDGVPKDISSNRGPTLSLREIFSLSGSKQKAALVDLEYNLGQGLKPRMQAMVDATNGTGIRLEDVEESNNRLTNGILQGLENIIVTAPNASIIEKEHGGKMEKMLQMETLLEFPAIVAEYDIKTTVVGFVPVKAKAKIFFDNATVPVHMESTEEDIVSRFVEEGTCFGVANAVLEAAPRIETEMADWISKLIKGVVELFVQDAVDNRIFRDLSTIISKVIVKAIQAIICTSLVGLGGAVASGAVG